MNRPVVFTLFAILGLSLVAAEKDPNCLADCSSQRISSRTRCSTTSSSIRILYYNCIRRAENNYKTCVARCPEQAARLTEIGRGDCSSLNYNTGTIVKCALTNTSPDMDVRLQVLRQLSRARCVEGSNYGIAPDNSFIWVTGGCAATFSVYKAEPEVATTTATTTIRTTTTTRAPTTTTATTTAAPTTQMVKIGRGACSSSYYQIVRCALPMATPDMNIKLQISERLPFSSRCVEGVNYGLANDNSFIWVSRGCKAMFSVMKEETIGGVTGPAIIAASTMAPTTTRTPTTTRAPTTTTTTRAPTTATTTKAPTTVATTSPTTAVPTTATTAASTTLNDEICGQPNSYRIIGGTQAQNCEYPWMVLMRNQMSQMACGGTIIDETTILTAAHCLYSQDAQGKHIETGASEILLFSGSSQMPVLTANIDGLRRRPVSDVRIHEEYNTKTHANDIAVLKLAEPIKYDNCHRPACLVDGSKKPQDATGCRTMGWGVNSNGPEATVQEYLQWAAVPMSSQEVCDKTYYGHNPEGTFCAGENGKDACQGDSGGPLLCREDDGKFYQYGVVSGGVPGGCGTDVGLYTDVANFLPWIEKNRV